MVKYRPLPSSGPVSRARGLPQRRTNDLVQYIFAASREDGDLEEYRMVAHPVILR